MRLASSGVSRAPAATQPLRARGVYRFPGVGDTGVMSGAMKQPQPVSMLSSLQMPSYQASVDWQAPPDIYSQALNQSLHDFLSKMPTVASGRYAPWQSTDTSGARSGGWGSGYSGGYTLSAYGFTGTSGVQGTKGSAPYGLQAPFWAALQSAFADMKKAGLGTPGITDGWRSYAGQVAAKRKWTARGKPKNAATPGRSVHGIGLAADLSLTRAQFDWLKRNGARYGLWNLPSESWHWQLDPRAWRSASTGAR